MAGAGDAGEAPDPVVSVAVTDPPQVGPDGRMTLRVRDDGDRPVRLEFRVANPGQQSFSQGGHPPSQSRMVHDKDLRSPRSGVETVRAARVRPSHGLIAERQAAA